MSCFVCGPTVSGVGMAACSLAGFKQMNSIPIAAEIICCLNNGEPTMMAIAKTANNERIYITESITEKRKPLIKNADFRGKQVTYL